MGELCLADAQVLCRLLLGDAALLAQQRDDAIEFDPHDLYILFRGRYRLAPGRSDAPAVFSTRCIL